MPAAKLVSAPVNVPKPQPLVQSRSAGQGLALPAVPVLQQKANDDEETMQRKAAPRQLKNSPVYTGAAQGLPAVTPFPIQKKANKTGLPDNLKAGVEHLSGFAMDDVKVHYNSAKPATLQAHAYAQGTEIHIAPGQEKHLPHEAWHVAQQKQGRVKPTLQMKGVAVNDDSGLEREADVMGETSARKNKKTNISIYNLNTFEKPNEAIQLKIKSGLLNLVGEIHSKSEKQRDEEINFTVKKTQGSYWKENEFAFVEMIDNEPKSIKGDDPKMRTENNIDIFFENSTILKNKLERLSLLEKTSFDKVVDDFIKRVLSNFDQIFINASFMDLSETQVKKLNKLKYEGTIARDEFEKIDFKSEKIDELPNLYADFLADLKEMMLSVRTVRDTLYLRAELPYKEGSKLRSENMHKNANNQYKVNGVWKIGENHYLDIKDKEKKYNAISVKDFQQELDKDRDKNPSCCNIQ